MDLGARLKSERERLGLSQTDFAAVAGASKHAQINWEKGAAAPNAAALAAWADHGLDVLYVVTGERANTKSISHLPGGDLPPDEQLLLEAYRGLTTTARKALLAELLTGGKPKKPSRKQSAEGGVSVSGDGNRVAGRDYQEKG